MMETVKRKKSVVWTLIHVLTMMPLTLWTRHCVLMRKLTTIVQVLVCLMPTMMVFVMS